MPTQLTEQNQSVADRLSEFMKLKPVAMLGAGVSAECYPKSWDDLIQRIAERIGVETKSTGNPQQAQELKEADEEGYTEALREIFTQTPSPLPATLLKLTQLPFKHFVTQNFDKSISEARGRNTGEAPKEQIYPKLAQADCTSGSVIYAHGAFSPDGKIENIDFLVLHTESYIQAYKDNGHYNPIAYDFFRFLFQNENILFAGVGLRRDEATVRLLRDSRTSDSRRLILFPTDRYVGEHEAIRDLYLDAYNIEVLYYDKIDDDHSGLTDILVAVQANIIREPKVVQNTLLEDKLWE